MSLIGSIRGVFIGLNLSHDSSISVHDLDGKILFAIQEERFSREKNVVGFPSLALQNLASKFLTPSHFSKIDLIVIGSHGEPNAYPFHFWVNTLEPEKFPGWINNGWETPPGAQKKILEVQRNFFSPRDYIEHFLRKRLRDFEFEIGEIAFVNHHDSHAMTALVGSGYSECLGISLDGSGDGESGIVQNYRRGEVPTDLCRIPATDSLGIVYSAVTRKYGFKPHRHEGKITGLAALGSYGPAVEYLMNCIKVKDGVPHVGIAKSNFDWIINRMLARLGLRRHKLPLNIERMIETASASTVNWPDLAFAIQEVIEDRILEITKYWLHKTGKNRIALSGGVFSNVKLNQKLAEIGSVSSAFVFPNMGDGGLSAGGVWRYLVQERRKITPSVFEDMYLGLETDEEYSNKEDGILESIEFLDASEILDQVISVIENGGVVGTCIGKMEFGPRALCNRSILADPRKSKINSELNRRLNRTEFMPFAPVVLSEHLMEVFEIDPSSDLRPYNYMTMTCKVRQHWKPKVEAIVHVDGTARPQSLEKSKNPIAYSVIYAFYKRTGIPLLINTSFNAHEEPIIENVNQAIDCLLKGSVDAVLTETKLYFLK